MADNSVYITGAASGAFVDALNGLPQWATESTAKSIESVLNKMYKLQSTTLSRLAKAGGSGGALNESEIKKVKEGLSDFDKELAKAIKDLEKQNKLTKEEEAQRKKEQRIQSAVSGARAIFVGAIIQGANNIKEAIISSVNVFDDLYKSGINVVSGFTGAATGFEALQQLTTMTGVRYTELAEIMKRYSTAVNAFGAQKFARAIKEASAELRPFGFSAKESAELLGAYLESQRGYADTSAKTQAQLDSDLVTFGKRITKLSQATGISREKLLQNIEAISHSVEANILAGQVSAEASDSTMAFIGSFKDQRVGQAFLRMMTDAIKPLNETFMNFQKVGFGGFGQKLMNFTQQLATITDPEEKQRAVAEFMKANKQEISVMMQRANLLRQAGVQEANGVLEILTGMEQQARGYKEVSEEERKRMQETSEASKAFQNELEKLKSHFQSIFAATIPMLNFFTSVLASLNEFLTTINKGITDAENWINSIKLFTDAFGEIDLRAAIGLTAVFAGLVAGGIVLKNIFKVFSSWLWGIISGGGGDNGGKGGRGRRGRGGATGRAGSMVGSAAGSAADGFLTGLGKGLQAIGNPKALLGVVGLAGLAGSLWVTAKAVQEFTKINWEDIAKAGVTLGALGTTGALLGLLAPKMIIGAAGLAALGGAAWVIGKAAQEIGDGIGKMGKGFEIFSNLDGSNLIKVAQGIGALSVALVAFAAGNIVSAGGNVISSIADGISSLFGGNTTVEKLKELAELGPGLMQTATAVSMLSGAPQGGTANSTSSPASSTVNSPSAVSTKQINTGEKAQVQDPSRPLGAGVSKPPADAGINTALAHQSALLEQMVQSLNSLVSTNKDILKYTRVHS